MHEQVEKLKYNKSRVSSNCAVQKKSNVKQSAVIEDNRPEALTSLILQAKVKADKTKAIQLAPCPIHKDDPTYDGHSDRKCPELQEDQGPQEESKSSAAAASEKQPGWKKTKTGPTGNLKPDGEHHTSKGNNKLSKSERDQRRERERRQFGEGGGGRFTK